MQVQAAKQPRKLFFSGAWRELTEAAVILSISVLGCAITIQMGGLQRFYSESHGDAVLAFDAFNTVVLFLSIAIAIFGVRRIAAQRHERRRRIAAERHALSLELHDPLTRLPNRRYFENELGMLLATEGCVTVLLMDLNGLQAITDLFGHTGGDACLVQASARLREQAGGQGCL